MAERVEFLGRGNLRAPELETFGYGDDRKILSARLALLDDLADLVESHREFRKQNQVRAASHARAERDPACLATHQFHYQHAAMRLGGAVKTVNRLGGNVDRRVITEGLVGAVNIVVDGLGHADDRHTPFVQARGNAQGVVAADSHEASEIHALEVLDECIELVIGWIGARSAKNCATEVQNT